MYSDCDKPVQTRPTFLTSLLLPSLTSEPVGGTDLLEGELADPGVHLVLVIHGHREGATSRLCLLVLQAVERVDVLASLPRTENTTRIHIPV